jgi:hypothetical protein
MQGIHVLLRLNWKKDVDGRDKPGHDARFEHSMAHEFVNTTAPGPTLCRRNRV